MSKSSFKCPICDGLMDAFPGNGTGNLNAKGVTLRCDNENCLPHENVYGYGGTEKEAHAIACQKYKKQ